MAVNHKDIKLSNLKGILIFLVVFGHFIEIYKHEYYQLYVFIYAFHMPLFVFISGYLAKRMRLSKILNLILLYLIFQTFFNWVLYKTGDYPLQFTYGTPHFHLWYIVSLGFWYGLVWIISKLNLNTFGKWITFLIVFIISFLSRWYTNDVVEFVRIYYDNFTSYTLSYQRTLSFMPFFFLGYFMSKKSLTSIYNSLKNRLAIVVLLIFTMLITFFYVEYAYGVESVFRGSFGVDKYLEVGDGFAEYVLKITIHYVLALWLCYLLFNLISNKQHVLTKWGDHSLMIFLFHPVAVFILRQTEFMDEWAFDTKLFTMLFIAMVTTIVLSSNVFVSATKSICNPYHSIKSLIR